MLVRNYGLYWRRDFTFWGKVGKGGAGHLKGRAAGNTTAEPVDFRDQQGVYALYDDGFGLVYVGHAGSNEKQRLFKRLNDHRSDQLAQRWTKFSWFGVRAVIANGHLKAETLERKVAIQDVLLHIEAVLIAVAEPRNNLQSGRFGEQVKQYLQFHDVNALGPTTEEQIRQVWQAIRDAN